MTTTTSSSSSSSKSAAPPDLGAAGAGAAAALAAWPGRLPRVGAFFCCFARPAVAVVSGGAVTLSLAASLELWGHQASSQKQPSEETKREERRETTRKRVAARALTAKLLWLAVSLSSSPASLVRELREDACDEGGPICHHQFQVNSGQIELSFGQFQANMGRSRSNVGHFRTIPGLNFSLAPRPPILSDFFLPPPALQPQALCQKTLLSVI